MASLITETQNNSLNFGESQNEVMLDFTGRQQIELNETVAKGRQEGYKQIHRDYVQETPRIILERELKIADVHLTPGFSVALKPFELLRAQPTITRALTYFRLFRAGIKLRFVLNSTPQNYGAYVISYLPDSNATVEANYAFVNANPQIVDLSSNEAIELILPFATTRSWLRTGDAIEVFTVYVTTLGSFRLNSAVAYPTLSVWASYHEPEIEGAWNYVAQSLSEPGVMAGMATVAAGITTGYSFFKNVVDSASDTVKTINTVKTGLSHLSGGESTVAREPKDIRRVTVGSLAQAQYYGIMNMDSFVRDRILPVNLADPNTEHKIGDILRIPTIRSFYTITNASDGLYTDLTPVLGFKNEAVFASYMDQICGLFRYWRGSIKVKYHFFTSPLVSARIRLGLWTPDAQPGNPTGDTTIIPYRELITIRGTTEVNMILPFATRVQWIRSGNTLPIYQVSTFLDQEIVSPGTETPSIFLVISVSAGDDFQVMSLCSPGGLIDPEFSGTIIQDLEAQSLKSNWKNFHTFGSGPLPERYRPIPEDNMTLEDAMLRFSTRLSDVSHVDPFFVTFPLSTEDNVYNSDIWDYILPMFRWARGSARLKINLDTEDRASQEFWYAQFWKDNTPRKVVAFPQNPIGNGQVMNIISTDVPVEFDFPYAADFDWSPIVTGFYTTVRSGIVLTPTNSELQLSQIFIAAGNDFQMAYLMPPFYSGNLPWHQSV